MSSLSNYKEVINKMEKKNETKVKNRKKTKVEKVGMAQQKEKTVEVF